PVPRRAVAGRRGRTRDQRLGRGGGISCCLHQDTIALGADEPRQHAGVGIDGDKPAMRGKVGCIAKAQREIEAFAQKNDEIGAAEYLGKGAEAWIVEATSLLMRSGPSRGHSIGPPRIKGLRASRTHASTASAAAGSRGCARARKASAG